MTRNIDFMIEKTTHQINKHRFENSNLKKRNKVYVLRKNVAISRSSKKLNQIKIESFEIVRNIRDISYELKLLDQMKIHLVFHKALLESTSTKVLILTKLLDDYIMNQEDRYQVQKISEKSENFENERKKYLVKWKDYDEFENTWELRSNFDNRLPWQELKAAFMTKRRNLPWRRRSRQVQKICARAFHGDLPFISTMFVLLALTTNLDIPIWHCLPADNVQYQAARVYCSKMTLIPSPKPVTKSGLYYLTGKTIPRVRYSLHWPRSK